MKFFLLANVGSTDILDDNKKIDRDKIRSKGKEILDNLELYKKRISCPIISRYLDRFPNRLKKIILFVTDQQEEKYLKQDTIYFGEIIKRIIEEKFQICVEVKRYCGDPMNFGQLTGFYKEILKRLGNERVIISISGGIPLMNYALLISSLFLFSLPFVYRVDEKTGKVKELDYKNIKKIFLKKSLIEFIKIYDYTGALKILENNKVFLEFKKFKIIQSVINYLIERLHFNFEKAKNLAKEILCEDPEIKKDLLLINDFDEKGLLYELYSNMAIKWYRNEIVDFMSRLFRFTEAILQLLFSENIEKIDWTKREDKIKEDFNKILEKKEIKEKVIREIKKARRNPGLEIYPNRFNIFFTLKVCNVKIPNFLNCLNELVDVYRHKSIIAHGYEGMSREVIDKKVKGDLLEKIRKLIITYLSLQEEIIFDKINKEILIPLIQKL